ncbi:MAG TPA: hypothetical protein VGF59_10055 [Bryobacteraceae bacterium]|jgi:hypothetical protein
MKPIACFATVCCLAALPGLAQPHFTGYAGGGFSEPVKDIGSRLDMGWNVSAGAGATYHQVGLMVDFMFNDFPINRATLNNQQVPDGTTRVWAFTLDPVFHVRPVDSPVDAYVTGGGGIYHRTIEFTQPALATVPVFDPFFGIIYPANIVTNQVIASRSNYKGGVDVGAGVAFKIGPGGLKLFAEARYHHMFTRPTPTTLVPVTFGIRW